jgi:hypothetical protein
LSRGLPSWRVTRGWAALLCGAGALQGDIQLESASEALAHAYVHGLEGDGEETGSLSDGLGHVAIVRQRNGLDGVTPWSSSAVVLQATHLTTEATLARDWLRVDGTASLQTQATATGAATAVASAGVTHEVVFTVSDAPRLFFLGGSFVAEGSTETNFLVLEQENTEGEWETVLADAATLAGEDGRFEAEGDLEPGRYRLRLSLATAAVGPEGTAAMAARAQFSIGIGTAPAIPPIDGTLPSSAPFWHPLFLTKNLPAPDLVADRFEVLGFVPAEDGQVTVEVALGFTNASPTPWSSVRPEIAAESAGGPPVEFVGSGGHGLVRPGEQAFSRSAVTTLRVAVADVPDLLDELASFARITWRGDQHPTFTRPLKPPGDAITAGMLAYLDDEGPPVATHFWGNGFYTDSPDFAFGDLVFYPGTHAAASTPDERLRHDSFTGHFPLEVTSVGPASGREGSNLVSGRRAFLPDFLIDGILRHTLSEGAPETTSLEGLYPRRWREPREIDLEGSQLLENPARPIHFNRIPLADFIEVDGSFALRPTPLALELEMEGGALRRLVFESGLTADVNLLLTVLAPGDNTDAPLAEKEQRVFQLPLFASPAPLGMTITPTFTLDVGASVDATQELAIPFTAGIDTRVRFGWVDGETFYEETATPRAPRLSDPTVFEEVGVEAEAWIAAQLALVLSHPSVPISGAPTIGARAVARFDLRPFDDPWWSLTGDLEVRAGFEASLAGLLTVADVERVLSTTELFALEASGPLLAPMAAARSTALEDGTPPAPALNPGLRPLAGADTRWVRGLRARPAMGGAGSAFLIPALGSEDYFLGSDSSGSVEIARIGPDGGLQWMLGPATGNLFRPRSAVSEPHGGLTAVGFPELSLVQFDGAGNILWRSRQQMAQGGLLLYTPRHLLRREDGAGGHAYWVLGQVYVTSTRQQPVLSKFDADGNLLWHRLLTQPPSDLPNVNTVVLHAARFTADGSILASGGVNVHWQSGDPNAFISRNGLLLSLDPETAETRWTTHMVGDRITEYYALAEDPAGNLYAAGRHAPTVTDDQPSNLISKFGPDGEHLFSRFIGHDPDQEGLNFRSTDLPSDGETFWDQINALVWADDALWAGGQIGLTNRPEGSQGFVMRLTAELGVTRFASYNGSPNAPTGTGGSDRIIALADGGKGLLVLADSLSFLPWPDGRTTPAPYSMARLLFKLPWEGSLRFHDLSAGRRAHPGQKRGFFYLYPRVVDGGAARPAGYPVIPPLRSPVFNYIAELPDTPVPPQIEYAREEPTEYRALEYVPPARIQSIGDYLAWHQLPLSATGDTDGDGRSDTLELVFGTDPWRADFVPTPFTWEDAPGEPPALVAGAPRSALARDLGLLPTLQRSLDLEEWEPETRFGVTAEDDPDGGEWLRFVLPVEDLEEDTLFLRFGPP